MMGSNYISERETATGSVLYNTRGRHY